MKKKAIFISVAATTFSLVIGLTSFAAGWQQDAKGWWYGTNADNSSWYSNGWQWIDGNGDGVSECYYFDNNGYLLTNTKTPDGYQVNAGGAWVQNGQIQTKSTDNAYSDNEYSNVSGVFCIPNESTGEALNNIVKADGSSLIVKAEKVYDDNWDVISSGHMNEKFRLLDSTIYYVSEDSGDKVISKENFFGDNNRAMGPVTVLTVVNGTVVSICATA